MVKYLNFKNVVANQGKDFDKLLHGRIVYALKIDKDAALSIQSNLVLFEAS